MNRHLNIFRTYSKTDSDYQLENDLTRALAVSLQEDSLFLHEVLRGILSKEHYNALFEDLSNETEIHIDIQNSVDNLTGFEFLYAVSLTGVEMDCEKFFEQNNHSRYTPICDLVIKINHILIIFEAKRCDVDCTSQLYNQAYNILLLNNPEITKVNKDEHLVTPIDLNWKKLMESSVKIAGFEKATGNQNRFLSDFINLVKSHKFMWLPEVPMNSMNSDNVNGINRRLQTAIKSLLTRTDLKEIQEDRTGFVLTLGWSKELLFRIEKGGDLQVSTYPGNTRQQGHSLFSINEKPNFSNSILLNNQNYQVHKLYHIKFSGQGYFSGLWFSDSDLKGDLYTKNNFYKFSGRKKREDWEKIEVFFDSMFTADYDWRKKCNWQGKMLDSNRSRFDISMGYELYFRIPFKELQKIDIDKNDISGLQNLLLEIYNKIPSLLITS